MFVVMFFDFALIHITILYRMHSRAHMGIVCFAFGKICAALLSLHHWSNVECLAAAVLM